MPSKTGEHASVTAHCEGRAGDAFLIRVEIVARVATRARATAQLARFVHVVGVGYALACGCPGAICDRDVVRVHSLPRRRGISGTLHGIVVHARGNVRVVDGVIGWRNSAPCLLARRRIEHAHPPGLAATTEHLLKSGDRHAAAVMADGNANSRRHGKSNLVVLEPPVRLLGVSHIALNGQPLESERSRSDWC